MDSIDPEPAAAAAAAASTRDFVHSDSFIHGRIREHEWKRNANVTLLAVVSSIDENHAIDALAVCSTPRDVQGAAGNFP